MTEKKHPAGGWPAIQSTLKHTFENGQDHAAKALLRINQPQGFDCPGCAWPEPKQTGIVEFCENGAKAIAAETTKKKVGPEFFNQYTVSELRQKDDYWLESQGRLVHPMKYDPLYDRYFPIPWEKAFEEIGEHIRSLKNPDENILYTSGRTSNEAAFLWQLYGRTIGTNNFPDCSNMCHESSGVALNESIGIGKGTVTLEDFEKSDLILVIGQNPGTNHPRMLIELQRASKRGAKIVAINPLKERGLEAFIHPQHPMATLLNKSTPIATHYYQPIIGGDMAIFCYMAKEMLEQEQANPHKILDHTFIEEHTHGYQDFITSLKSMDKSVLIQESGLTDVELKELSHLFIHSKKVIACWAMGLTQHRHAVATLQTLVSLMLLGGHLGREGAGLCPVRGHSNVQGDRTMGITEKPKESFLEALDKEYGFTASRKHGFDTVEAIEAMLEGKAKVFLGMGGNFVRATPDSARTEQALRNCSLTAHVTTKLNRSHLIHGKSAYILPCIGRTEIDPQASGPQKITVEDSMGCVHASIGTKERASSDLLSEPAIIAGLAQATLTDSKIPWKDYISNYSTIRNVISRVIPGFEQFNQRIESPGGFLLKNSARDREWKTSTEKAQFSSHPLHQHIVESGTLRLMTIRSHDQYNTTIYGLNDRYRGIKGERRILFLNPIDLNERDLKEGDWVDIKSEGIDGLIREAKKFKVVPFDIPKNCAAAYFPETNVLVPLADKAIKSGTPVSKFIPITIQKQ